MKPINTLFILLLALQTSACNGQEKKDMSSKKTLDEYWGDYGNHIAWDAKGFFSFTARSSFAPYRRSTKLTGGLMKPESAG